MLHQEKVPLDAYRKLTMSWLRSSRKSTPGEGRVGFCPVPEETM